MASIYPSLRETQNDDPDNDHQHIGRCRDAVDGFDEGERHPVGRIWVFAHLEPNAHPRQDAQEWPWRIESAVMDAGQQKMPL